MGLLQVADQEPTDDIDTGTDIQVQVVSDTWYWAWGDLVRDVVWGADMGVSIGVVNKRERVW